MKQKFKIDKDTHFYLPSTFYDITLGQWAKAEQIGKTEPDNLVKWVSLFSSLPESTINNFPAQSMVSIWTCLSFLVDAKLDIAELSKRKPPIQFTVNGKVYNPTIDFSKFNVGQYWAYNNMCKSGKIPHEQISRCIAICLLEGEWSDEKVGELEKGVMELPIFDALALHGFFLNKYLSFLESQSPSTESQNLKKLQQVLQKSQKNTVGFIPSILSRMGIRRKNRTISI